jgi:hypothetical protein
MENIILLSLIALVFFEPTLQDIYLHNPRGSNNRLNEKTANRQNANRVFDSEVSFNSNFFLFFELKSLISRQPRYETQF